MFRRLFARETQSKLIEAAFQDFSSMLSRSSEMLRYACRALLDNEPLQVDLDEMDDIVDEGERMVRRTVLQHLSVNPSQDLVVSLVLVSMVQDAERIGDFARGLGELVQLARKPREGVYREVLKQAMDRLQPMFQLCEEAFREDDREKGRQVMRVCRELKSQLAKIDGRVAASDLDANSAVVYSSAARMLRRISAHLSNIASSVTQPYDRIRSNDELA